MYILIALTTILSFMVIFTRNIVYSLVFLISTFFLSAVVLLACRLEFLGYVLIVVYVGAISILFLFVVMTLDIDQDERLASLVKNSGGYISHIVAFIFSSIVFLSIFNVIAPLQELFQEFWFVFNPVSIHIVFDGAAAIYTSLYTINFPYLILSGFLLLVAMVGATLLTLEDVHPNQDSNRQSYRKLSRSVFRAQKSKTKVF